MKRLLSCVLVAMAGFGLAGCGSDDDDDSGGGAALQSCSDLCAAQDTGGCMLGALQDCQDLCAAMSGAPAACKSAIDAYDNCVLAQPDVCGADVDTACQTQSDAMTTACQ
jgi:hypothetical protein